MGLSLKVGISAVLWFLTVDDMRKMGELGNLKLSVPSEGFTQN